MNSVEAATLPWVMFHFLNLTEGPAFKWIDDFVTLRLDRMETVLAARQWLAGRFSAADILMVNVLRPVDKFDGLKAHPACCDYLARAIARPAFAKAHADQLAQFSAGD